MQVAIQGEAGSFHDEATRQLFNEDFTILPCPSFSAVFEEVNHSKADYGVVAIENSLYGSLHEVYDQLLRYDFTIIDELSLPIHQQLIAKRQLKLDQITELSSHPAALDQCREFIVRNLPQAKIIEHTDTAGAVKDLQNKPDTTAAIASVTASILYGYPIIAENIEDEPDNITRFIVINKHPVAKHTAKKASLIIITPHTPGALYHALGVFNNHQANLTKLESRPVRGQPFRYQFITDVEANRDQLISIVHELEQLGCEVKLLGHY